MPGPPVTPGPPTGVGERPTSAGRLTTPVRIKNQTAVRWQLLRVTVDLLHDRVYMDLRHTNDEGSTLLRQLLDEPLSAFPSVNGLVTAVTARLKALGALD